MEQPVVGIVMGLAVAAYVAIAVDTTWHISYLPLVVVLVLGIVLNFIKKALYKKQQKGGYYGYLKIAAR